MIPARFICNLDCELTWTRRDLLLPRHVAGRAAALSTMLRALCGPGERLWTLAPVDPHRVPDALGLPRPTLESGPVEALPRAERSRWWGRIDEASARANDKTFAQAIAEDLGEALEGSAGVRSIEEAAAAIADLDGPWVFKARHGVSGRNRVVGEGRLTGDPSQAVKRLLRVHSAGVVQPFRPRIHDLGITAFAEDGGARDVEIHTLEVDRHGIFRGIQTHPQIDPEHARRLRRAAAEVARRLHEIDYRGPFGIDALIHGDHDATRLCALLEVNARYTFGFVARALSDRLERPVNLRTGDATTWREAQGRGAVALLLPGSDDPTAAWIE